MSDIVKFSVISGGAGLTIPSFCRLVDEDGDRPSNAIQRSLQQHNRAARSVIRDAGRDGAGRHYELTLMRRDGLILGGVTVAVPDHE